MLRRVRNVWRDGIRPGTFAALGFGVLCFAVATAEQITMGVFADGMSPFRAYFPAILVATLIAGERAGILVLALGMLAGWDAMMRPFLSLNVPDLTEIEDVLFFLLTSAVIVWVAESYRLMLRRESGNDAQAPLVDRKSTRLNSSH